MWPARRSITLFTLLCFARGVVKSHPCQLNFFFFFFFICLFEPLDIFVLLTILLLFVSVHSQQVLQRVLTTHYA